MPGRSVGDPDVHPIVVALVALLIALAIASVFLLHRKARSVRAGHEVLALDSDAMRVGLTLVDNFVGNRDSGGLQPHR